MPCWRRSPPACRATGHGSTPGAAYYGVPWANFATWFVAALILGAVVQGLLRPRARPALALCRAAAAVICHELADVWPAELESRLRRAGGPGDSVVAIRIVEIARMPKPAFGAMIGRGLAAAMLLLTSACLDSPNPTPSPVVLAPGTNQPALPSATAPLPTATEVAVAAPTTAAVTSPVGATTLPAAPAAAPTPATRNPLILQALSAMTAVQSYHYTATVQTFDEGHKLQSSREGDYAAPDGLRWINVVDNITTTAVLTGSAYYVAVDTSGWTNVSGGAQERAHQLSWQLIARAQDVVEAGRDPDTDPDPTIHLTFTLPLDNLPLEARPWQVAQGEVWLGVTDYRVRAYKLFAQEPHYETTERVFLSATMSRCKSPCRSPTPRSRDGRAGCSTPTAGRGDRIRRSYASATWVRARSKRCLTLAAPSIPPPGRPMAGRSSTGRAAASICSIWRPINC